MDHICNGLCTHMMEAMSSYSFFSEEDLVKLSDFFQCRDMSAGEILWKEGDECKCVAFITSGRLKVTKETDFKGNRVVLGIHGKGAFLGTLCILDGSPRVVTAEALEDAGLVIITRDNFDKLMAMHPKLGAELMRGMLLSVSKSLKNSFDRLTAIF